jgi:chromate transporter
MSIEPSETPVPLVTIAREWGRIGLIGFGGPPAHIALLRKRCVDDRGWLSAHEFEDGIAVTNLLPGPASTQLAIFCAWRLRGGVGAVVGGLCFIVPGLVIILGLASLFLASNPPTWVLGVAGGLGAVVPAVAVNAAVGLVPGSWKRTGGRRPKEIRWVLYLAVGAVAAAVAGAFVVVALLACGIIEVSLRPRTGTSPKVLAVLPLSAVPAVGGLGALTWVAFKVGALSYGGGFVIIPLMQHDATAVYHWMSPAQFLNAVALGQVTPGPVVLTVAVVGYAAAGIGGGLLAAAVAFTPSFLFVVFGGSHFDRLRADPSIQSFLTGAGAAAIGAIAGASITLLRGLDVWWQFLLLGVAALWLLVLRRNVVAALLTAGAIGAGAVLAGAPIPR